MDVVYLPLIAPRPKGNHREDWESGPLDEVRPVCQLGIERFAEMVDPERGLWVEEADVRSGWLRSVPVERARRYDDSLRFIEVEQLRLVPKTASDPERSKLLAQFTYAGLDYEPPVTHPKWEDEIDEVTGFGPCYLNISLGREHNGYCYKLVAALIRCEDRP